MTTAPKPVWKSKTMWVNLLAGIITVGTSLAGVLPDEYGKYVVMVVVAANLVLRFLTDSPISLFG